MHVTFSTVHQTCTYPFLCHKRYFHWKFTNEFFDAKYYDNFLWMKSVNYGVRVSQFCWCVLSPHNANTHWLFSTINGLLEKRQTLWYIASNLVGTCPWTGEGVRDGKNSSDRVEEDPLPLGGCCRRLGQCEYLTVPCPNVPCCSVVRCVVCVIDYVCCFSLCLLVSRRTPEACRALFFRHTNSYIAMFFF